MPRVESIQEIFEKKSEIDLRIKELRKEQEALERKIKRWQFEEYKKERGTLPMEGV